MTSKRHAEITAAELCDGHILRINVSTNYVKVAKAEPVSSGRIAVTIYNGDEPAGRPYRTFAADEKVSVSTFNTDEAGVLTP